MTRSYVSDIQQGGINITSVYDILVENENKKAFQRALDHYDQAISTNLRPNLPTSLTILEEVHSSASTTAVDICLSKAFQKDGNIIGRLTTELSARYKSLKEENENESSGKCHEKLGELFFPLIDQIESKQFHHGDGFRMLEIELEKLVKDISSLDESEYGPCLDQVKVNLYQCKVFHIEEEICHVVCAAPDFICAKSIAIVVNFKTITEGKCSTKLLTR